MFDILPKREHLDGFHIVTYSTGAAYGCFCPIAHDHGMSLLTPSEVFDLASKPPSEVLRLVRDEDEHEWSSSAPDGGTDD